MAQLPTIKTSLQTQDFKNFLKIKSERSEIRMVYFGTPEFSAYILEQLINFSQNSSPDLAFHPRGGGINQPSFLIQAVVTRADKPVGRKQQLTESQVSQVAQKYQIPTLKPEKLNEEFIKNHLSLLEVDLFIVVAYGKILPQKVLDIPRLGAINVHGSLLPKYRGASPIQSAILNGDKGTGITIMLMDAQMDHGPILTTKMITLSDQETSESLSKKMMVESAKLLLETLPQFISGKIIPRLQNHDQATYCNLIKKGDGYFDINNPPSPEVLDRMIRAYYPWPNAWTKWQEKIIKFYPGEMVQMEGKKAVKLEDFLRGYPDFPVKKLFLG